MNKPTKIKKKYIIALNKYYEKIIKQENKKNGKTNNQQ